ncbi:hypothetical protein D9756_008342 [Leucocoprinus leucothites]|uniref:HAM1-like N-terminal domain-containing protein n=1 Tax=Leucocoprinus leucothites TaxID=201217 RepID=A0A8H5D2V7_9AGAR|nr:hypothetical protein D9756_008342 [Leucoagaricus leucothites]
MDACLSCFSSKRRDEDREPLLPKHQRHQRQVSQPNEPPPDEPLSKLVDVLAALSAGKLPSQTQINDFLRRILRSNILRDSQDTQSRTTPDILRGNGPLSKRGRKVIQDVSHVIEALLQFGMEKNDDDLLQDLFTQFSQIESDEYPISLEATQEASAKLHQMKDQAGKVKDDAQKYAPRMSEVSQDAKTLVKELKSLFTTFLTSSVFRLLLADAISIGRDWVAHAASDVGDVALRVHDIAADVEHKAEDDDLGRSWEQPEDINLKEMATSVVEESKAVASGTVQHVQESVQEKRREWEDQVAESEEEVKRKILTRIQEMVTRAQKDPPSQRAIITILQIIRKYAHRFAFAKQETVETVREAAAGPSSKPKGTQSVDPGKEIPAGFADPSMYPPQPYGPPPPKISIPGIEIDSPHLQYVLQDVKIMVERLARGHKIDDMLKTLGDIIRHSVTAPQALGKNVGKLAQEKLQHEGDESSSIGTTKHTEHHGPSATPEHESEEKADIFSMYFSSVGQYLDRALTRPGWATSKSGQKSLEALYEATQELLQVAGDVVADTEDIVKEGIERSKDLEHAEGELKEAEQGTEKTEPPGDRTTASTEERAKQDVHQVADQWVRDIAKFLNQAGDYIDAVERDRSTMKLAHALEELRSDTEDLFGTGREEMGKAAGKFKTKFQHHARASGTGTLGLYIQWLGWALPRLLRFLPLGAIPVPRVEIQTDDVECAIDALWIRGLALKSDRIGGRYGATNGPEGTAPGASWQGEAIAQGSSMMRGYEEGGIGGKLIPDEILVRQWTEVKVSLAEGMGAAAVGADDARYRMGLGDGQRNTCVPGIEASSRMRVCMDGIKACAHGMGYYFKYTGSLIQYEDEGVVSVDLGTATGGGRHSGFGLDIELEMDKGDVEMDLSAANTMTGIPILVVEDADTDSGSDPLDPDVPPNLDVQEAIYEAGHHPSRQPSPSRRPGDTSTHRRGSLDSPVIGTAGPSRLPIKLALANVLPLFRVLDVQVDLRGVKFKIDESRHWVFNKLFVEPFAGPLIKSTAKQTLEERVRKALEAMASGMALIVKETKERAVRRRVRQLSLYEDGQTVRENREFEEEEDGQVKLRDFYAILLERGPEIFAYYTGGKASVDTETHTELTSRGVVFTEQTHTHHVQHQPGILPTMMIPPQGLTDDEGNVDDFGLHREQEREYEREMAGESIQEEETHEVRVAVGTGAQLFPGKGGPYGAPKDTKGAGKAVLQEVREGVEQVKQGAEQARESLENGYENVKGKVQEGYEGVKGKGRRFGERREREREGARWDWRSSAFDL